RQDGLLVEGERLLDGCGEVRWEDCPDTAVDKSIGEGQEVSRYPTGIEVAETNFVVDDETQMSTGGFERAGAAFAQVLDEIGDAAQKPLSRAEHGAVEAFELGPTGQ